MMIGLPGSGKSYHAKEIAKKERAVLVSTDQIRYELFGDEKSQKNPNHVYFEVYSRIEKALLNNRHVVLDATNSDREKRIDVLSKFPDTYQIAVYLDTTYETCLKRNQERKRTLDLRIMEKYRKKCQIPFRSEGFDEIQTIHESINYGISKNEFIALLKSECDYESLFNALKHISLFNEIINFDQESPFHSFTLCRHTYHVLEYLNAFYEGDDKLLLQLVGLFHDTGKPFCKTFKPLKGHYSYWAHEVISSHLVYHFLYELGFEQKFIEDVTGMVEMHMAIGYGGEEGARQVYHLLGAELQTKLYIFNASDRFAK